MLSHSEDEALLPNTSNLVSMPTESSSAAPADVDDYNECEPDIQQHATSGRQPFSLRSIFSRSKSASAGQLSGSRPSSLSVDPSSVSSFKSSRVVSCESERQRYSQPRGSADAPASYTASYDPLSPIHEGSDDSSFIEITTKGGWLRYMWTMVQEQGDTPESRLVVGETLELVDTFLDLWLLAKVSLASLFRMKSVYNSPDAFILLLASNVVALTAYLTRSQLFYHRVPPAHIGVFIPGLSIPAIRGLAASGDPAAPGLLMMLDHLQLTFRILMRVLEDIPQILLSVLFLLSWETDLLILATIGLSVLSLILSTYKMGAAYPWVSTFSLLISQQPPTDENSIEIAAPTTDKLSGFMAFACLVYGLANNIAGIIQDRGIRKFLCFFYSTCLYVGAGVAMYYYVFLQRQKGETRGGTIEMRPVSQSITSVDA